MYFSCKHGSGGVSTWAKFDGCTYRVLSSYVQKNPPYIATSALHKLCIDVMIEAQCGGNIGLVLLV